MLHFLEEALQGRPVHFIWIYLYKRFIKNLKEYIRNQARLEGSIAKGYIVDEALILFNVFSKGGNKI